MTRNDQYQRRGAALVFVIILLAIMAMGVAATWRYLHQSGEHARRTTNTAAAEHLAAAGLEKAIAALRQDPTYSGEIDTALGAGRFTVEVARNNGSENYALTAVGELTDEEKVLKRMVLRGALSLAPDRSVREFHWKVLRGES